jgi:hypothetical protein
LNIGGKILEKVPINSINYHVFSHNVMNNCQYGFTPRRSTVDVAMEVYDFVREGLTAGDGIVLLSLDVKGAFDAAYWPNILNGLRTCDCLTNLYDLTKSYLSQCTATLSTNVKLEREVSKWCPGLWNIRYSSLTNLPFKRRT